MPRQYVTTAIDFPNAAPHMGHVMEKILADVMVRWFRLRGDEVRFHIGTDENGIKIQQTAKQLGITPRELVDRNAPVFHELFTRLGISFDYFIRTADPQSHWPTVTALWKRLEKAGVLERRTYTGLYCMGCERFWREVDLVEGLCPDHKTVPEKVTEENWFYLLSRKQKDLQTLLDPKKGTYRMIPDWRGNETLAFLKEGLEDVSFSRSKQTLTWGVPVPGDDTQVMYVWCDNLTSYISSLGYLTDHEMKEWWDEATVTHVIGKDIARFHALNWPAMLQDAGIKTPDRLLIHGFLTSEGQKMSKSLGNVVVPQEVIDKYGVDALRFYLSHQIPVGNDGDFSWKRFGDIYAGVLGAQFGNLLNRVLILLRKEGNALGNIDAGAVPEIAAQIPLYWKNYEKALGDFRIEHAVAEVTAAADLCNKLMQKYEPWKKTGTEKLAILTTFAEALRHIALLLLPIIPQTAQKISKQLNVPYADSMLEKSFVITDDLKKWGSQKDWKEVGEPAILFPSVEAKNS